MKAKPTNGDRVVCSDNTQLRVMCEVGTEGTCCGDVWMQPDLVWVQFDGQQDTQQVDWELELEELR